MDKYGINMALKMIKEEENEFNSVILEAVLKIQIIGLLNSHTYKAVVERDFDFIKYYCNEIGFDKKESRLASLIDNVYDPHELKYIIWTTSHSFSDLCYAILKDRNDIIDILYEYGINNIPCTKYNSEKKCMEYRPNDLKGTNETK